MKQVTPIWIKEADVVQLMDLAEAIDALEVGLQLEAKGLAKNMSKTHVSWGNGSTLHAIGASFEGDGIIGTKSWAHTEGGATPLLLLWDANDGALLAIIEAFALGQLRTGAMSGVATRWMSARNSSVLALIGTGKQALAQLAAVASVRPLQTVRVWGRDEEKRKKFIASAQALGYGFAIETPGTVADAARGAHIVTLVTRAREPFFTSAMAEIGTHINAVGAITPEREEFKSDVLERAGLIAVDDPIAARKLSKEFGIFFKSDAAWTRVAPISKIVASGSERPAACDLSIFKAMGMGISDLSLGIAIYRHALEQGLGRALERPNRNAPRLGPSRKD